jgi:hypothetical protein
MQNCITQENKNRMKNENLDSIMLIAVEGPTLDLIVFLWMPLSCGKMPPSLGLFTNPKKYLSGAGQQMRLMTSNPKPFFSCF